MLGKSRVYVSSPAMPSVSVCRCVSLVFCVQCMCLHTAIPSPGSAQSQEAAPLSCCQKTGRKVSKWLFSSDHTPEVHLLNAGRLGHTSVHSKGTPWRTQLR